MSVSRPRRKRMNTDRMGRRMNPKTQEERCEDEDGLVLLWMGH